MAYTTINKSGDYFNTKLYAGNNGTNAITGVGFQPDFNWIKDRTSTGEHLLVDVIRGMNNLRSNSTTAESANGSIHQQSLDSDGFTVAGSAGNSNASGRNYASWNWKANGAGSANTDGDITSTVSANTTSGFSVGTYTGNLTAGATVGHGLGTAPKVVIVKSTSNAHNWAFYHYSNGAGNRLILNGTDASSSNNGYWNSTDPSSSVFTLGDEGNDTNGSGKNYVFYAFADVTGYSKFGSYVGNGSNDGTFVYTGFKPAFLMIKNTGTTENWNIWDNKRDTYNAVESRLYPNTNDAESTSDSNDFDFLSNGFKIRNNGGNQGASGNTYIYMAFAEAPLVGSNNVPATAR